MVPVQYRVQGGTARAIADAVEAAIRGGELAAGASLPTVRAAAADGGVAPGTVAAAYRLLRERGLVEAHGRLGTQVRPRSTGAGRAAPVPVGDDVVDLATGHPDPTLLPRLQPPPSAVAAAPPAFVLPELHALARQRLTADGVDAAALTLAQGGLDGIRRVLEAHLRPGDGVAVEDPGWPNALDLLAALGLRAHAVPLDAEGIVPAALRRALRAGAKAAIVTSRAQNPTGAHVTARRAADLREVLAGHPGTLVVEDDHAAELAGVGLAPLAGATGSWAFVRSTSKPYGPDLRLALLAGDPVTVARVDDGLRLGAGWVSTLLQQAVLSLWTSPSAIDQVAAAGAAYDERRDRLVGELAARGVASSGRTGLNVWVPVRDETAVVTRLLRSGWAVAPGARFRSASAAGVRITVSALRPATIGRLADDVAAAIADAPPSSYTA